MSAKVFKPDLYIAADDGKIYHLSEGQWNSPANLAADGREKAYMEDLLEKGVTVGVLLEETDVEGHGTAAADAFGTCYLLNLNALKHKNKFD